MKFSARTARRKWPCAGSGCGEWPMVTTAALLLMLCLQAAPATASQRRGGWSQPPWGELFGDRRARRNQAAQPVPVSAQAQASVPLPKPRPAEAPVAVQQAPAAAKPAPAEVATPAEPAPSAPPPPSACRLALTEEIAVAPSIPAIHGPGGCGGEDLVRLEAIVLPDRKRVPLKPPATLRCSMATAIADWVRTDIVPLTAGLGSEPAALENFDSYECRGFNGVAGAHLSEHGHANALDVGGFRLADGRSIGLTDRAVPRELRESVLHSVCTRFMTVLGPGSDGYHEDHIHIDLMERHNNYKICQWNVWDPLPQIAPLLPAERPDAAPPREVAAKSDTVKTQDLGKPAATEPDAARTDVARPAAAESDTAKSAAGLEVDTSKPATKKRRQSRRF
jgi:hypothetical protein